MCGGVSGGSGAGRPVSRPSSPRSKAQAVRAIMDRFDHVTESSKVGIRKPDPAIYRMACEALGVEPGQCVYLDDLGINCKPAAELGMIAIKVTGEGQALDALCEALEIDAGHF